jgi:sortase B
MKLFSSRQKSAIHSKLRLLTGKRETPERERSAAPKRGFRPAEIVLLALFSCILIVSLSGIAYISYDYITAKQEYDSLTDYVTFEPPAAESAAPTVAPPPDEPRVTAALAAAEPAAVRNTLKVDFGKLTAINPEMSAWLLVQNTRISYPVVYSGDNEKYLTTSFEGKRSSGGCIFIGKDNSPDFSGENTIIYGHNMRNNSMFGELDLFNKKAFFESHQTIYVALPDKQLIYKIFSSYTTTLETTYTTEFESEAEFRRWVKTMRSYSYYKGDDFDADGVTNVITLSTCVGNSDYSKRKVLHAYLSEVIETPAE